MLNNKILKKCSTQLANYLVVLVNKSYEQAIVPSEVKRSRVIVIYKDGCKRQISNYRPISLPTTSAVVLETVVRDSFYNFLESRNFFTKAQHG